MKKRIRGTTYPRFAIAYPVPHPLRPSTEVVVACIEHGYLGVAEFLLEVEKVFESGIEVVLEGK
jgi:hypothetical protein